ncbi:MAG TPA: response regulator [Anaerolineaceae bacterium]|nr:response regulator [Anaerolineaceae bacterium]HPN50346.1 response regulator [Anaerolineaceae bacterium]
MAKILIAEDERDIRDLVKFTLQFAGHEVFAAEDGQQAVEMAEEVRPDLILSDIRMPRMTGYEACQKIKSNPAMANIPVVFLSAKGQEAEIQYGLEMGADAYLLKPFEITDLVLQVATLLAKFGKS